MNSNVFDLLAFCGRLLLPSLSVLYASLGEVWGLPFTKEIPLTLSALAVFVNSLLKIDSMKYFDEHEIIEKG